MEATVNEQYDVTVHQIDASKRKLEVAAIGHAHSITLDELGTLTIEGTGTIRSFPQRAWDSFNVTRADVKPANPSA